MDPKLSPNQPPQDTTAIADVRTEDHVVWSQPERTLLHSVEWRMSIVNWLYCLLATLVIAGVATAIVAAISDAPLTGEANTELGVLTIIAAMSTFIGFAVTLVVRLVRVPHDRLTNSMSVAAIHIGVALLLFLGELAGRAVAGDGVSSALGGAWTDQLGNVFTVLERSAAASVVACMLAPGMVPALGGRPQGTQTEATVTDHQL